MWKNWVELILGIWLVIVPNIGLTYGGLRAWNVILGIIFIILAVWDLMEARRG